MARRHRTRHLFSYVVLAAGAMFMLVPLLWMLSASLKPQWQIFTDPPIWIPQRWEQVPAGTTNRPINLWKVDVDGDELRVVEVGTRKYTTVVDPSRLAGLERVSPDLVGDAVTTTLQDGTTLNVRVWDGREVVALARDGDDLVVVPVDALLPALSRLPLDVVNRGERVEATVEGVELRGRVVASEDGGSGTTRVAVPIGPESELAIVAPPGIVERAVIAPVDRVSEAGSAAIGETELRLVALEGSPERYVSLVTETWQPVIDDDELRANAFLAPAAQLGERAVRDINGVALPVATFTPAEGAPYEVGVLVAGTGQSLVAPITGMDSLRLAQLGGLVTAGGASFRQVAYRAQEGFTDGTGTHTVALVGDPREMALLVPETAITDAFDVDPAAMERDMHAQLSFDGYREALGTKVADTTFPTFFRNSFILVVLNAIGHLLSCIIVAYAFARLRAPGKGLLFLILLSTMMLPFPVTLVPVYEIFRDMGMINTLFPLFIRSFLGNAFLIFMLRQFFMSIPRELEEAARIDGANVARVIWHVIVPLSRPAIATVVIFTFWWTWNSFLEPFIYLSSPDLFPVSVGLNFFKDQYGTIYYDRMIAASVLSMLPMLIIFFFAQRYFIEGIQLTGLKG